MHLVPVVYRVCGHTSNILSPGVHDNAGVLQAEHVRTNAPVNLDWHGGKCLKCTPAQMVPEHIINELRKAKYGEEL